MNRSVKTAAIEKNRRIRNGGKIAPSIFLVIMAVYFLVPIWWLIVASTKTNGALYSGSNTLWFSGDFSLIDNIKELGTYSGGIFWRWFGNSLLYAIVGGSLSTIIAVLAGYGFAKYQFKGRNAYFKLVLAAMMIPNTALVIPTFVLFSTVGLTNSIWAVILPSTLNIFGVYLMRVYCQGSIPDELIEAARVDGAGELRILLQIALPVMRPALATVFMLSIVGNWNNYFLPSMMLTNNNLYPITVGLTQWQTFSQNATGGQVLWNLIVTGSLISIIPLILAFFLLQRYWVGGLTAGAVKS
ncbi:carbohydrate ABC transporter permease [Bifidobacterium pullorum subsp. gallinarum]|uniref:Carbohydrate ABC transporter permease n=1 Tax=Bifidobacterium pullorum subsp. gallinarum TaxID=78344 RepID=A0A4P6DR07_9BIFI|nr:carbohydrate ABC transporter permease [Bifidobacterium pullorum]QAY32373.1 carbohydrate ABC transporter permease [Bifidobacterium pullorum subsp. gallinarum]